MNPQELRIGRWYQAGLEFKGSVEAKLCFTENREFLLTKENLILILQLNLEAFVKPIPLTEQWLDRAEFQKDHFEHIKYHKMFEGIPDYYTLKDGWRKQVWFEGGQLLSGSKQIVIFLKCRGSKVGDTIEFVHHFQNVWSDLTGTELTLKE